MPKEKKQKPKLNEVKTPCLLFVEGDNDLHVIAALCKEYKVPQTFEIFVCEGKDDVMEKSNASIKDAIQRKVIGVVLDADTSVESRWTSICAKISRNHPQYQFPDIPEQRGTVVLGDEDSPRLGFWLMPNNQTKGMLEDFCLEMVEPQAHQVAKDSVENAQVKGVATFIQAHFSKAIVHTYLAWQDEPGRPLGQSITSQALRPNTKTAIAFTEWLKRLFS